MREIKFRAWDKEIHKFKYPDLWDSSMPSNWRDWYELMQYTGLKDKNGKEIFEGDIVKYKSPSDCGIEEIKWNGESISLSYSSQGLKTLMSINFVFEVIGNIYEDEHLLEANQ